MPDFVRIGRLSQFQPGVINECKVGGRRVLVVNLDGTLHAVSNVCPHVSLPLDDGYVTGSTIVCPFHGSAFELAMGACVEGPAAGDALDVYEVCIEGDDVLIAVT